MSGRCRRRPLRLGLGPGAFGLRGIEAVEVEHRMLQDVRLGLTIGGSRDPVLYLRQQGEHRLDLLLSRRRPRRLGPVELELALVGFQPVLVLLGRSDHGPRPVRHRGQ